MIRPGENRANIKALFDALMTIPEMKSAISSMVLGGDISDHQIPYFLEFLAECLARRGVIAPAAVTVAEATWLAFRYDDGRASTTTNAAYDAAVARDFRADLEKIAKGEA